MKSKVTVEDFIKMKERQLNKIQTKKPTKESIGEFYYINGMIDAAKLIRKTFKLK
jgi:hypothetical protein